MGIWLTFDLEDVHSLMKRTEQSWNLLVDRLFLWNIEGIRHHTVWPKTSILFESLWFPKILRLWSLWYWMWILIWLWLLCPYQCQHRLFKEKSKILLLGLNSPSNFSAYYVVQHFHHKLLELLHYWDSESFIETWFPIKVQMYRYLLLLLQKYQDTHCCH